jgi:hypothetical protein
MDSQYGTSQLLGLVQLLFTNGSGAFVIKSQYGAVSVSRQGTGIYQFQLNTGVNNGNIAPIVNQYNAPQLAMNVTWGNPTTPLAAGLTEPSNIVELDFTVISGGSAADPSSGVLLNVAFQTCFDGETGETF